MMKSVFIAGFIARLIEWTENFQVKTSIKGFYMYQTPCNLEKYSANLFCRNTTNNFKPSTIHLYNLQRLIRKNMQITVFCTQFQLRP